MNSLPPEIQKALTECRKEMANNLCREQTLTEENDELKKQLLLSQSEAAEKNEELKRQLLLSQSEAAASILALAKDAELWRKECFNMQNSLSWRITKPLRVVKKVIHSLRTLGLKLTILKVMNRRK